MKKKTINATLKMIFKKIVVASEQFLQTIVRVKLIGKICFIFDFYRAHSLIDMVVVVVGISIEFPFIRRNVYMRKAFRQNAPHTLKRVVGGGFGYGNARMWSV